MYHWGLLAVLLLLLLYPHLASGKVPNKIPQTLPNSSPNIQTRYIGVAFQPVNLEHVPVATQLPSKTRNTKTVIRSSQNCVQALKDAGLLPQGRVTLDGYARSIPSVKREVAEGEKVIIKTSESTLGHILYAQKINGQYISLVEGGHPVGAGRTVPADVVLGVVE